MQAFEEVRTDFEHEPAVVHGIRKGVKAEPVFNQSRETAERPKAARKAKLK
jgi:hypothetical protein